MTQSSHAQNYGVFNPLLPSTSTPSITWGRLYGSARGLAIASAMEPHQGPLLLITSDTQSAIHLEQELRFFQGNNKQPILLFPDWETLPYDVFSPHEDIISQRLETLYRLRSLARGVLIVPINTLMQRLAPQSYLDHHSLILDLGQRVDQGALSEHLTKAGYIHVSQVTAHGEFTVRGSIIDLFPMGSPLPFRIDLFDDEIESIRVFDPEKQTSIERVDQIRLLPAREFPSDEAAIKRFRNNYRIVFEGNPNAHVVYRDVSQQRTPAGIEYYLPLFFDTTQTLFDYLPQNTLLMHTDEVAPAAHAFEQAILDRYEQRRHDPERPVLPPQRLYLSARDLESHLQTRASIQIQRFELEQSDLAANANYRSAALPNVSIQPRAADPAASLRRLLSNRKARCLFVAESPGRREVMLDVLRGLELRPKLVEGWQQFLRSSATLAITVAPIEQGLYLPDEELTVITEDLLIGGERARQQRRRKPPTRDAEAIIRNLTDLNLDSPVVHEDHGVGRYLGLQKLTIDGLETEFLTLAYAGGDKLYVPVASLHLISRYTGTSPDSAPLHRLGSDQWQKIKRKAAEKARDVAAELLEIFARRSARPGISFQVEDDEYAAFASTFPFEETPDQRRAIEDVQADMAAPQPMDRLVCGDVGFGKTEVAMRAAFIAVQNGKQCAVFVPTTLLAQQHFQTFRDRFADWPVRIEMLSRFRNQKQQKLVLKGLSEGAIDIVIGTHKLLHPSLKFKDLGLIIIDEEHRFGVRHKERLKNLRAEIDVLTLTATPIPRTLNMSLSGLRNLSIITTPPDHRLAIKTFVNQWNDALIQEACQREMKRGGQVYFLHNKVETIEKTAKQLQKLLPNAAIKIAHGQMRERELEQVMLDFYHQRFSLLVCSTIIESGIDVPNANTIVINRADKLGLAQLHQLRGRVGRSHHRAYAYLITPPKGVMTADASKRLEAIESLEELGVGFTLATHDLEIRGAGELLGEDQSGQIQEIGFSLYNELLERAVKSLKSGELANSDAPLDHGSEVDLGVPALLPDDYVPDVHTRLILYKRIASATTQEALRELKVEMIDRFGLLPEYAQNLFAVTQLKLQVAHLGMRKLEVGSDGGRIVFDAQPKIDFSKLLELIQRSPDTYKLDGENRLRFTLPMSDLKQRIDTVLGLVDRLALKQAA